VVIPTLNEVSTIEAVIGSLAVELPADTSVAFVVADGGSTDGTQDAVRRLGGRYRNLALLANPARIQSAGVNLAAKVAGTGVNVLIRCDAHAAYPPGYVRRLLETLDRTGADAVVVAMDSTGERNCIQRAAAWISDTAVGSGGAAHRGGHRSGFVDHGHHAAFRMASFLRCGGYDEGFTHNEDAELDCRLRELGARIYLDAEIRIGYFPRARLPLVERQYFCYGYGRSRTVKRHPRSLRARQLAVPLHIAASIAALAVAPWWPALLVWPLLYLAVLVMASIRTAWQHRSACGLLSGPVAAVMHFSWAAGFAAGLATAR
jgi:succinoglycan biosynthesis protein ExoA